jgi:hypothetical protein
MTRTKFGTDREVDTSRHGDAVVLSLRSGRTTTGALGQQYGLGVLHGGCSEMVDALLERGYTMHVGSLEEHRGQL